MRWAIETSRSVTAAGVAGALLVGAAPGAAQGPDAGFPPAAPEEVGLSSAALRGTMDSINAWIARERIVGAVLLVIRNGRMAWHQAAGWSDRERGVPLRTDHIVSMRSMTKPLVGMAVMMLVEEGKLAPEDRVSRFLPSFDNERSRDITIFQLLTHTSGITGAIYNDQSDPPQIPYATLREAVDAVGAKGPEFPPGTRYSYSDPGSSTLGAVIAQVSGMPAEDFIQRRILDPLGMRDSYLLLPPPDHAMRSRVAATYRREAGRWTRYWDNSQAMLVPFFRASGGLWATSLDYARFMHMMLRKGQAGSVRVLRPATVELALQPHAAYVYPPDSARTRDRFYGFHWTVLTDRYGPVHPPFAPGIFEHGGSDGTMAWADPARDLIIIYLTQSRGQNTRNDLLRLVYGALSPSSN
ncbi:MAG TPA: serine hydrolase domain-containing protein [Gemmatimonadales bacterium]|nr:serine hydrolase domain-containing protein [Gemmatimonadales bacterium]